MMRLMPLRGVHHRCACWHRDASRSRRLRRMHHRRPRPAVPGRHRCRERHAGPDHGTRLSCQPAALVALGASPRPGDGPRRGLRFARPPHLRRHAAVARTWPARVAVSNRRTQLTWPARRSAICVAVIINPGTASKHPAPAEVFSVVGILLSISFDAGWTRRSWPTGSGTPTWRTRSPSTHTSTGKDRGAAETVAGVLLGTGWACTGCEAAYIGTPPESGLCEACEAN